VCHTNDIGVGWQRFLQLRVYLKGQFNRQQDIGQIK